MQANLIEKIAIDCDIKVRDAWKYQEDGVIDEWRDYSDFFTMSFTEAMAKNPWAVTNAALTTVFRIKDDCDAMAMTTLCRMHKKGIPLDRLFVGVVYADTNQTGMPPKNTSEVNHAIGLVDYDGANAWRVIGDTFGPTYRLGQQNFRFPHRIVYSGKLTDPTNLSLWSAQ